MFQFSAEENDVWKALLSQQLPLVSAFACKEYIEGLEKIKFPLDYIPSTNEISQKLRSLTGWSLCPVNGLVPNSLFFRMLSQKKFPVIRSIRKIEEIEFYTNNAPDIFHEYFGHCPLLANEQYAESLHLFGKYTENCTNEVLLKLTKIFWVTFEFGVIKNNTGIKIYGAGILPSKKEILKVVKDDNSGLQKLDLFTEIDASLQGNIMQSKYYFIENLDTLHNLIKEDLKYLILENESISR